MHVVREEGGRLLVLGAAERQFFSGISLRVLRSLAGGEKYPKEIARELRVHEQKVYYHVRRLEKRGFIEVARKEERGGALAKVYRLSSPAFVARFGQWQQARRLPSGSGLEPFVRDGRLDARIIVGSPEPHGPERARSRDISFAVDLALFLGTFLTKARAPAVMEDKDAHAHDLRENLIVVGGPITNKIAKMANDRLPVRFDRSRNIVSRRKTYRQDECGFIARAASPFDSAKKIMVIAGKRYSGTKAAVLAFTTRFDEVWKKNFTVVQGLDNDGDGEVDSVRVLE